MFHAGARSRSALHSGPKKMRFAQVQQRRSNALRDGVDMNLFEALFRHHAELRAALAECTAACKVVDSSFGTPERHRFFYTVFEGPHSTQLANKWQSAIAELKTNPETKLPNVEDE